MEPYGKRIHGCDEPHSCTSNSMLYLEDVKEFIRLVKKEMPNQDISEWEEQQRLINQLAGSDLI